MLLCSKKVLMTAIRWRCCLLLNFVSLALASHAYGQESLDQSGLPNILLIMADDLGYSDIGAFGAEIDTPNIDQLASEGISYRNFHVTPACAPTRAELLTGVDMHKNGLGVMHEVLHLVPYLNGVPGYEGYLNDEVVTVGDLLEASGYSTMFSGKWHLGSGVGGDPQDRGFQYSFALAEGGANHFSNRGVQPNVPIATYTENGERVSVGEGFYSSRYYTDKLIEYVEDNRQTNKPFFAILGYTAPHWPLQAPKASIIKYENTYTDGWDKLRVERFEQMKKMGLVEASMPFPDRWQTVPAWSALSEEDRIYESRLMAIYAAMVDDMDKEIGRLLDYLKSIDQYEDTVILFLSDNGPDSSFTVRHDPHFQTWVQEAGFDNSLENVGNEDSFVGYHKGWAQVSATPLYSHKGIQSEGGTRVPLIVTNLPDTDAGQVSQDYVSVRDLLPTMLAIAGKTIDDFSFEKHRPTGIALQQINRDSPDRPFAGEFMGSAFFYRDGWKLFKKGAFWRSPEWRLFHLDNDLGEQVDLAAQEPQKLQDLIQAYDRYANDNNVVEPKRAASD